ncbi:RNA polymerase sigma factor [bacterium]|nr:RNA polymerase sigma factor [bacterium]
MEEHSTDYERFVAPIEDQMIHSVWRIVRNRDDFEEAFQEALANVWKRLDRVRKHPNPKALILRMCANAAYDALRRRARMRKREVCEVPETMADPAPAVIDIMVADQDREEIFQAIGRLPRNQAEAFLMRFVQEMPYGDIAEALDCSEVTARTHVMRARVKLSDSLAHLDPRPAREVCE